MVQFFVGHGTAAAEILAPPQVFLGPGQVGFALGDHGRERIAGGIERTYLSDRLCQRCLRLVEGDTGVGTVEFDQHGSRRDSIGVVGINGRHRAGDLRRDLYDVAGDVGIVGGLVPATDEEPPGGEPDADDDQGEGENQQRSPAPGRYGDGGHGSCGIHVGRTFAGRRSDSA